MREKIELLTKVPGTRIKRQKQLPRFNDFQLLEREAQLTSAFEKVGPVAPVQGTRMLLAWSRNNV